MIFLNVMLTLRPSMSLKIKQTNKTNMEQAFLFIIAISLALLVGKWGSTRKIGFGWAFGLSLFNLIIGIIAVACSKKKENNVTNTNEFDK